MSVDDVFVLFVLRHPRVAIAATARTTNHLLLLIGFIS
jgi:hypothetical protein